MADQHIPSRLDECRADVLAAKRRLTAVTAPPPPTAGPTDFISQHPALLLAAAAAGLVLFGPRRALAAAVAIGGFALRSQVVRRYAAQWAMGQVLARRTRSGSLRALATRRGS